MPSARIQERGTVSGNQMRMARPLEDATQSFLPGTPVIFNNIANNGAVTAPTGSTTPTAALLTSLVGIAKEFGANLPVAGVPLGTAPPAAPLQVGAIPPAGGGPTYPPGTVALPGGGGVPNQPGAANLLRPVFNDGRTGVILAISDTVFYGQIGPGPTPPGGSTTPASPPTQADIGKTYGLTQEPAPPNGDGKTWYIDRAKNTAATGGILQITGLDQWDTARGVLFTFLPAAAQLQS